MSADPHKQIQKIEKIDLADQVNPRVRGRFLKNLGNFQTELARVLAGFVPALVVWSQRKQLPALIFRSLRRVQDLRQRGRELGVSFDDMHISGNVPGRELLEKLCHAPDTADVLQGGMVLVHETLVTAIEEYLNDNAGVYDSPSVSLLEADRDELRAQVTWAREAVAILSRDTGAQSDNGFIREIQNLCEGLPALLREHNVRGGALLKTGRQIGALPLSEASLPLGFRHLEFGPESPGANPDYSARSHYHAVNFLQEVQAADSCASLLFDAPDMPWDFFLDLSRHMWDESRHAMFGESKLAELSISAAAAGLSTKAYTMRQTLSPLDRYAALSTQEADAFPGKHQGLKDAVAHDDALSAKAWSYDIADETQHLRYGTKWIPIMMEKMGDPRSHEQVKADACNWRVSVLAEVYKPAAATLR